MTHRQRSSVKQSNQVMFVVCLCLVLLCSVFCAQLGDKVQARALAAKVNVPTIAGSDEGVESAGAVRKLVKAGKVDFPIMLKAAYGGGGRGMRIVNSDKELDEGFASASQEAVNAFGYVVANGRPRH